MTQLDNTIEDAILDITFLNGSFTPPTTCYLRLYSVMPTDASAGTEVTGTGYTGQAITWNAASARSITNNGQIQFDTTGYGWSGQTVAGWGIHDAATGAGTIGLMAYATLAGGSISVDDGEPINFADGTGVVVDWTSGANLWRLATANALLDRIFRNQTWTNPTSWDLRLHDGDPGDALANEFTAGGYAPQSISFAKDTDSTWTRVRNTADINFTNLNNPSGDTPIAWWTVTDGTVQLARFNQTDTPLAVGDDGTILANALEIKID